MEPVPVKGLPAESPFIITLPRLLVQQDGILSAEKLSSAAAGIDVGGGLFTAKDPYASATTTTRAPSSSRRA